MPSLRRARHSPATRTVACALIGTPLFALVPLDARAAIPSPVVAASRGPAEAVDLAAVTLGEAAAVSRLARSGGRLPVTLAVIVWTPSILAKSAFGELLAHTGNDPQPYAFTGEPYDANIGWQYHRARWMDARTGRFSSEDTFEGDEYDPPTLHKYLYVSANPVTLVDHSGHEGEGGLAGTMVSITISISINALTTFNPNAPIASLATAVLTGTAEGLIPVAVPEKILSYAWRFARPVAGGIWKFGSRALVGLESPIAEYGLLKLFTAGKAGVIQAHHIIEQRFLKMWGLSLTEVPAQILTQAEHEALTQKLLKALPAGYNYTKEQVWKVYQQVYADAPGYLLAIEKYFR